MNDTKLLPCPFCGGEAEMGVRKYEVYHYRTHTRTCETHYIPRCSKVSEPIGKGVWQGGCAGRLQRAYKTEEEAVSAWNRRAE